MDTMRQDLRYAMRQFVRRPGFTAIAVVSLAIGIGGNSLIFRRVLTLAAGGVAIGIVFLIAAGQAIRGLLYEVAPSDPVTIVAVAATLALVAIAAAWSPAWRASRVDPIEALRYE
jgi:hypothetical protein